MATYTYKCNACEEIFETQQSMKDDPLTDCPFCEKENVLERIIVSTAGGFRIWGRGVHRPTSSLRS